jgi:hypothetical protein
VEQRFFYPALLLEAPEQVSRALQKRDVLDKLEVLRRQIPDSNSFANQLAEIMKTFNSYSRGGGATVACSRLHAARFTNP